jgi:hypothetical protein
VALQEFSCRSSVNPASVLLSFSLSGLRATKDNVQEQQLSNTSVSIHRPEIAAHIIVVIEAVKLHSSAQVICESNPPLMPRQSDDKNRRVVSVQDVHLLGQALCVSKAKLVKMELGQYAWMAVTHTVVATLFSSAQYGQMYTKLLSKTTSSQATHGIPVPIGCMQAVTLHSAHSIMVSPKPLQIEHHFGTGMLNM